MNWLALRSIRFYQRWISPALPSACRYQPTCSEYGYQAIAKYGIIKGGRMAIGRILRCNPFFPGGYDPVE
jgi:putative membrane protein insertion efficiency factor